MRCARCPGTNACLGYDGPENASVLFIGEAPGKDENRKQQVFVGRIGDEVNRHYLPLAGLRRDQVGFINAISCLPTTSGGRLDPNKTKDLDLLQSCAETNVYPRIERGHVKLIVPLGSFACRAVAPDVELDMHHGRVVETPWGIPAFPMYHPASGIHEPKKMLHLRTDWHRLKSVLKGTYRAAVDDYPDPDYREVIHADEIEELDPCLPLGADTESKRDKTPFCVTYSQRPGTGRLVRAGNIPVLQALGKRLRDWKSDILVHNLPYDEPVFQELGLHVPFRRFVDTMAEVYHLGNLPQGLKALAFRECGMVMEGFEDVVSPHSRRLVLQFYQALSAYTWPKPEESLRMDPETGLWKLYKPQSMSTKLKRFWTDLRKNPAKDVFKMWEENWVEYAGMLEGESGLTYPGMCVSHAPFERVLHYACRDSDATLRLWLNVIRPMRRRVRKYSQELWRVA